MRLFGREIAGYAKTLVILVAVLLVAGGLCGLQLTVYEKTPNAILALFTITGVLEILALVISVFGVVIVLLLWGGEVLYSRFSGPQKDKTQKLFGDADNTNCDER